MVGAARQALDAADVNLILPHAREGYTAEMTAAFERVFEARNASPAAREVADLCFHETTVRLHQAGEGAPYTGVWMSDPQFSG